MTPKEKAKELIDKYEFVYIQNYTSMFEVIQCALIAVDEIIDLVKHIDVDSEDYWEEVKQEIINN
jgi:diphthamide biosynthesis methyltransferase